MSYCIFTVRSLVWDRNQTRYWRNKQPLVCTRRPLPAYRCSYVEVEIAVVNRTIVSKLNVSRLVICIPFVKLDSLPFPQTGTRVPFANFVKLRPSLRTRGRTVKTSPLVMSPHIRWKRGFFNADSSLRRLCARVRGNDISSEVRRWCARGPGMSDSLLPPIAPLAVATSIMAF